MKPQAKEIKRRLLKGDEVMAIARSMNVAPFVVQRVKKGLGRERNNSGL